MELVMGLVVGAGALLLAKRGRKVVSSAIGWSARKSGWVAGRVRSSLNETAQEARAQYERGRQEATHRHVTNGANGASETTANLEA